MRSLFSILLILLIGVMMVQPVSANPAHPDDANYKQLYFEALLKIYDLEDQLADVEELGYKPWRNVGELVTWLKKDPVSEQRYIPVIHDCDDFALELCEAAAEDGRVIGIMWQGMFAKKPFTPHLKCFAHVGNIVYQVDPRNDNIALFGRFD